MIVSHLSQRPGQRVRHPGRSERRRSSTSSDAISGQPNHSFFKRHLPDDEHREAARRGCGDHIQYAIL